MRKSWGRGRGRGRRGKEGEEKEEREREGRGRESEQVLAHAPIKKKLGIFKVTERFFWGLLTTALRVVGQFSEQCVGA